MKKLSMKNQLPKQTIIAVGLAFGGLLLGLGGYLMAVSPEKGKMGAINGQIQVARASLISAEEAPAKVTPAPAKAVDLFRLTEAMPDTDDIPGVLIALSQLAKSSSVTIQTVTPTADVPVTGYSSIPMTVIVQGTYTGLTRFLTSLRRSVVVNGDNVKVRSRLFVPTGVNITSLADSAINATVSLDAFVYGSTAPPVTDTTSTGATTTTATTTATTTTSD